MPNAPRTRPTSLAWFPYLAEEWEKRGEGLSAEEEGNLMRACRKAWRADVPCTLADTPAAWERLFGAKWRAARAALAADFTPDPDQPRRVCCAWLRTLWEEMWAHPRRFQGARPGRRPLPLRLRRRVLERDGHRCRRCAATRRLEIGHVVPVARGGSDSAENLQVLCMPCNRRKSDRLEVSHV